MIFCLLPNMLTLCYGMGPSCHHKNFEMFGQMKLVVMGESNLWRFSSRWILRWPPLLVSGNLSQRKWRPTGIVWNKNGYFQNKVGKLILFVNSVIAFVWTFPRGTRKSFHMFVMEILIYFEKDERIFQTIYFRWLVVFPKILSKCYV